MSEIITYPQTSPQYHDTAKITLDKILQTLMGGGSSGGGVGAVSDGAVDPVAAPTNPAIANWYVNTTSGTGWLWPAGGSAWQQIV